ncbi:protein kinase-like domain, concanavalin A-like lectin/glucanase domain protein [Tanacetum coccineum]
MECANTFCSTSNREFLDPKKKKEIESWLGNSRIVDSFDGSNETEYFDTFPILEELEYHEWLLKYPKPSWVQAKIRTENLNNINISCKIGHFLKRQAYIDLESPINVMSKQHYNKIMNKGLDSESHKVITIDVLKANDLLVNSAYRYLDVRTEEEFKKGHVDVKDVINIPNMFNTPEGT